ncbi:MAG: hypothetical protein ACK4UN_05930, partial [Limisphaerales bacterium]
IASLSAVLLVAGIGLFLSTQARDQKARLHPLFITNAPLQSVLSEVGTFEVVRKGTPEWNETLTRYSQGSNWQRHLAKKMENSSAYGENSSLHLKTWIFLDEEDRLIDFEVRPL